MTVNPAQNQEQQANVEAAKPNDRDTNLVMIRKQLEQERLARQQAEERAARMEEERKAMERHKSSQDDDDEDDDEPYIDKKKLKKNLEKFEKKTIQITQTEIQKAVQSALAEERRQNWVESNPDFYEVMQHADKFAEKAPSLAKTILNMPEGFERQKLVYENIKAMGVHKKEEPKSSIQETVDKNKKSPYYQPSSIGSAPYAAAGDFSPTGQKAAYDKMKELKSRLRLG